MSQIGALTATLRKLAKAALETAQRPDSALHPGKRAVAIHDTERDDIVMALSGFSDVEAELIAAPDLLTQLTPDDVPRIVLQLVYDFLWMSTSEYDERVLQKVCDSFIEEAEKKEWQFLAICNLEAFSAENGGCQLDDGLFIKPRSYEDLAETGLKREELDLLRDTWAGGAYVLTVEERIQKSPENLVLGNTGREMQTVQRALSALRLTLPGGVHMSESRMLQGLLVTRVAGSGFPPISGARVGTASRFWKSTMLLRSSDLPAVTEAYHRLKSWKN